MGIVEDILKIRREVINRNLIGVEAILVFKPYREYAEFRVGYDSSDENALREFQYKDPVIEFGYFESLFYLNELGGIESYVGYEFQQIKRLNIEVFSSVEPNISLHPISVMYGIKFDPVIKTITENMVVDELGLSSEKYASSIVESSSLRLLYDGSAQIKLAGNWKTFVKVSLDLEGEEIRTNTGKLIKFLIFQHSTNDAKEFSYEMIAPHIIPTDQINSTIDSLRSGIRKSGMGEMVVLRRTYSKRRVKFYNVVDNPQKVSELLSNSS